MEHKMAKIIVIFEEKEPENVAVKDGKYLLYEKMAGFVDKFEELFKEYQDKISPEIVKNAPDDMKILESIIDTELEIRKDFYSLFNKINDICFSTADRAYGAEE